LHEGRPVSKRKMPSEAPIAEWRVQQTRLTCFPTPSAVLEGSKWWECVVGQPPEEVISKPRNGRRICEGAVDIPETGVGKLSLYLRADRIDWLLTSADDSEDEAAEVPTLGRFDSVVREFSAMARKWFDLPTCPSAQRLAFGAVLVSPVSDRPAGYKLLSEILPVEIDPEGSSDFLYQINRPRDDVHGFRGLKINRLSKWSVMRRVQSTITLSPSGGQVVPAQMNTACRLELDINTAPDNTKDIARDRLDELFAGLVGFGREIAEQGDVR